MIKYVMLTVLLMAFTASFMLNIFAYAPQCLDMGSEKVTLADNTEFNKLVNRLNALPK